ncbi:plasmid recombination protein [Sagittula sp. SSi028]|uniref:plasmid recombination protein n=1 Tax=Sagittula sp. SSi028 TaxID=3400636 RepID=UPI003AF5BFA4
MKDYVDISPERPAKARHVNTSARDANPRAVSVRIEARSMSQAKGTRRHDFRIGTPPAYVDASRIGLNRTLIPMRPLFEIRDENAELRKRAGRVRAMKANAAVITSGIITFGRDAAGMFESLDTHQQDAAFEALTGEIADRLNTQVESLVVHLDESTIHAHFALRAYTNTGEAVSAATQAGTTAHLQDIAAEVMQQFHPGIERGHRKRARLAAGASYAETLHRSVRELHQDLPDELDALHCQREGLADDVQSIRAELEARQSELDALEQSAAKTRRHLAKLAAKAELSEKEAKRRRTYAVRLEKKENDIAATKAALVVRTRKLQAAQAAVVERGEAVKEAEATLARNEAAVAEAQSASEVETERLMALSGTINQQKKEVAAAEVKLAERAREVESREREADTSLAVIEHVVEELAEETLKVQENGKIALKDAQPLRDAPKPLLNRLMPAIFKIVRKRHEVEVKARFVDDMMRRVRKFLGREDLPPEVAVEADDLSRNWTP